MTVTRMTKEDFLLVSRKLGVVGAEMADIRDILAGVSGFDLLAAAADEKHVLVTRKTLSLIAETSARLAADIDIALEAL